MFKSLKNKITSGFISITLIAMIALGAMSIYGADKALNFQMDKTANLTAIIVRQAVNQYSINNASEISKEFDNIKQDSKGEFKYISLAGKDKKIIAHSDSSSIGKEAIKSEEFDKILKGEELGGLYKTDDGEVVYNVSMPFYNSSKDVEGVISVGISLAGVDQALKGAIKSIIIVAIIILILAAVSGLIISSNIVKPINIIVDRMKEVVKGDFTIKFNPKKKDEIGNLMDSLNYVMETLREIIGKIQGVAINLDEMSKGLSASSEEVAATGEEATNSVDEVVIKSRNQAEVIEKTTEYVENFSRNLDIIHDKMEKVSDSSNIIKGSANRGEEELKSLVAVINDMKQSFDYSAEKIDFLDNNVGKITEVMDVINAVAEQTNLLALNAAIEAARAGEAGKGFAVVAEEIRKLAEQVLESSKSITELVQTIMMNTKEVSQTTELVSNKIDTQMSTLDGTVNSFKNIIKEIEEILPHIKSADEAVYGSIEQKNKIVEKIEEVNSDSQELADYIREVSASIESQESSVEEVSSSAEELSAIASEFSERLKAFKIK